MTSYAGRHAELYDLFYAAKPYREEAEQVDAYLSRFAPNPSERGEPGERRERGKRLLDLACGTGEHATAFARLGYEVTGVDHSADMLARARAKAERGGATIALVQQDMTALALPGPPFDAVTCLFDSLGYLIDNVAIARALAAVRRHLAPGGLFVFELWHAPAFLRHHEAVRVKRFPVDGGTILRVSETSLDLGRQVGTVAYSVYELREDGTYAAFVEKQSNRYFQRAEIELFLTAAGYEPVAFHAGFSYDERLGDETWHIVGVARNPLPRAEHAG